MSKKLPEQINYNSINMFKVALEGIKRAIKEERNLKIDIFIGAIVILCAIIFQVTLNEWLFLIFAISNVFVAEMVNTIVENIVDWICLDYNEQAKKIKDISCGMVFIACIFSAIVGLIIFVPYIL